MAAMMQSEDGTIDLAAPIDSAAHDRFLLQYLHNQCILDIVFEEHRCASVAARARDFFSPAQGLSRGAVQARVPLRRPAEQEAQARARGGARGGGGPEAHGAAALQPERHGQIRLQLLQLRPARARAAFLRTSSTRASARLSPQVGPLRYAQHLDKCMAKGGRRAAREGNEARRASAGSGNR